MKSRKNILDFAINVLALFGFCMLSLMTITWLFGEAAQEISGMFAYGGGGVSVDIMVKFLVLSVIIAGLDTVFSDNGILGGKSALLRQALTLVLTLAVIIVFILLFDWMPKDMWQPWVLFLICFILCCIGSFSLSVIKTKIENKQMEEGLKKLKEKWSDEKK